MLAEIAPAGRRGEYMGLYTMSFSLGFSLGPWLGATLLESRGPQVLWGAAFCIGMCFDSADEPDWGEAEPRLGQSALGKRSKK